MTDTTNKPPATTRINIASGRPADAYREWRATLVDSSEPAVLAIDFKLSEYWLPEQPQRRLTAVYLVVGDKEVCAISDASFDGASDHLVEQYFDDWVRAQCAALVGVGKALPLEPVHITKPWGQEIWYTGVEERGVCAITSTTGSTPLPWVQAALPAAAIGSPERAPVLLKILDPSPEPVTGDLYFELHLEKREVYVVTQVDASAWPDGIGAIRYGFSPDKIAAYDSEADFRAAYKAAVGRYESVRRALDESEGAPNAYLLEQEATLRSEMDAFTNLWPLRVGDVVKVPLRLPHSLQHGVRTVEFQTPVYERQILSFAQRVLTQNHWDTNSAVENMRLTPPEVGQFPQLVVSDDTNLEQIVDFDDFEVLRLRTRGSYAISGETANSYVLVMPVRGEMVVDGQVYGPEDAAILPRAWAGLLGHRTPGDELVVLLARPRSGLG